MFEEHDIALTNAQRNLNQRGVKKPMYTALL